MSAPERLTGQIAGSDPAGHPLSVGQPLQAWPVTWLHTLCREHVPAASAGILLLRGLADQRFTAHAYWQVAPNADMAAYTALVEQAIKAGQATVRRLRADGSEASIGQGYGRVHIAHPFGDGQMVLGVVFIQVDCSSDADLSAALRQIEWATASPAQHQTAQLLTEARHAKELLAVSATLMQQGSHHEAAFVAVNELVSRLGCQRVSLGTVQGDGVSLLAVSRSAWFERSTPWAQKVEAAMDEVRRSRQALRWKTGGLALKWPAVAELGNYLNQHEAVAGAGDTELLIVPLERDGQYGSALVLERACPPSFTADEQAWVQAFGSVCGQLLEAARKADRSLWRHALDSLHSARLRLLGPGHYTWKVAGLALALVMMALTLVPVNYRILANTVIEGERQRVLAAPFQGFIAKALVRAGDQVKAGQVLAELDTRELRLEEARWLSEREQAASKLRDALARRELADSQILAAQVAQANAQLQLARTRIDKARIMAPFDALVINGDLSQLLGAPVEEGKTLFELAPTTGHRVVLKVDERDIAAVQLKQSGTLRLNGLPGQALAFQVSKITPVSSVEDGLNHFRVEATLADKVSALRPGLEGLGKIDAGQHSLIWIWTHRFTDWLRLSLWRHLP